MSSTSKTQAIGLNQWAASDPVLREDFNGDNLALDGAFSSVLSRLGATQKNVYDLLLQNYYDGKVTDGCIGISFDGFADAQRISGGACCGVVSSGKYLAAGSDSFSLPAAPTASGSQLANFNPAVPGVVGYIGFLASSSFQVSSVQFKISVDWGIDNTTSVLKLELVDWDHSLNRPGDNVSAEASVSFTPSSSGSAPVTVSFPLSAEVSPGLHALRLSAVSGTYTGANAKLHLCGEQNLTRGPCQLYGADKSVSGYTGTDGAVRYSAPYLLFAGSASVAGESFFISQPANASGSASVMLYIRHSGGVLSPSLLGPGGAEQALSPVGEHASVELGGRACTESVFSCNIGADSPALLRLKVYISAGAKVYDYGLIWM